MGGNRRGERERSQGQLRALNKKATFTIQKKNLLWPMVQIDLMQEEQL